MLSAAVWLMLSSMLTSLRISGGGSFPKPLTAEEERMYLQRSAAGDLEARNILIERNLRLVAHIMKGLKQSDVFRCEKMTRCGSLNFRKISSSTRSRVLPFLTTM